MTLVEPRWDEARAALAAAVRSLPPVRLPLAGCDGVVLAEDLVALSALPSFDTAAMDGWAVRGRGPWTVTGASLAGSAVPARLAEGEAVVIATGAMVPAGADAVIRSEDGSVEGSSEALLLRAPTPTERTHVRPAGEECLVGDLLVPSGTGTTPAVLGLAAASGHDSLAVVPRPRVALVLFGDELAHRGIPGPGVVRDSLGPQVPGWLRRMGAEVVGMSTSGDTLVEHVEAIARAAATADIVVTTGGTAAGPVDHLHAAIAQCEGELVVDTVAVRPGHPMLAARVAGGSAWLLGLPGNPLSAIVTLMSLGRPLVDGLSGRPAGAVPALAEVVLAEPVGAPPHEDRLVPGTVERGRFTPATHLGSGMLRGLAGATGFAVVPPGGRPAEGRVRWLPLPP